MKNLISVISSALLITAASFSAMAQGSATAYQSASASVEGTLNIYNYQDLSFGSFAPGSSNGALTVSVFGNTADNVNVLSSGNSGYLYVYGIAGSNYYVTLPNEVTLYNNNNTNSYMVANNFTAYANNMGTTGNHHNLYYGYEYLAIGATLNVNANQENGVYQGSYPITVSYE